MIARSVPEIHCTRGDPDFHDKHEHEEELGILVVGLECEREGTKIYSYG